ncbi:DUF5689 domain-containing protein [Christiangramia forsetii]|uniref:DUF5689 domain-containing protein n=2 Tax=Christiangramia forsetii TaxID=411153 RepID=A0M660_CHRFK|nr:DUF5689 domain-containing protein [Christiangramia forsetii]GGG31315.1 hypothetical protein GCM10011532_13500 [Christiangramia forsetii]CAL68105.1 conserved hypothetical protein [Christiangramia forsetii KT0803]
MKYIKILSVLAISTILGCIQTDDFELPDLEISEIEIEGDITSIAAVKGNFNFETEAIYTFRETDTWFEAYVISNDAGGNFYKELIVQDKPSNPTSGIHLLLDHNSLFDTYNLGRKIYVKLDGLSLWYNNGVLQLGIQNLGDVVPIPNSLIDDHIIRSEITKEIEPLNIEISDFNPELKNLYVSIQDVQFDRNLIKEEQVFSFASNPADQYDGERQLENCETGETVLMSTSTYSNFKSLLIPNGSGSIEGILTRDFYDEHYVIVLNAPDALDMSGDRCDTEYLGCGDSFTDGSKILFEENFDGVTSNTTLNSRGWTNINVSGGEKKFTPTLSAGNRVLRVSAYNTNESPLEAWLVTPALDLSNSMNETLSFDILSSYDKGLILEVYITQDFTGDPRTTEWIELDANIPLGPSSSNSRIFKNSKINISCLEDKVWVGFRYLGSTFDKTTTYDLDNVRVIGE